MQKRSIALGVYISSEQNVKIIAKLIVDAMENMETVKERELCIKEQHSLRLIIDIDKPFDKQHFLAYTALDELISKGDFNDIQREIKRSNHYANFIESLVTSKFSKIIGYPDNLTLTIVSEYVG